MGASKILAHLPRRARHEHAGAVALTEPTTSAAFDRTSAAHAITLTEDRDGYLKDTAPDEQGWAQPEEEQRNAVLHPDLGT